MRYRNKNTERLWLQKYKPIKKLKDRLRKDSKFFVIRPTFWLCDVCNHPLGRLEICLDHNHNTGNFRGWICKTCNLGLGYFNDSPNLLNRAIQYLVK